MRKLGYDAEIKYKRLFDGLINVHDSCKICISSGRPSSRIKIFLKCIFEESNECLKTNSTGVYIHNKGIYVLYMVDAGTHYGERCIAPSRSAHHIKRKLESL